MATKWAVAISMVTSTSGFLSGAPKLGLRDSRLSALKQPKKDMRITLLPGDGIGPEIMTATVGVLNTLAAIKGDFSFTFNEELIGGAALDATNEPFPAKTLAACQASDSVLLACIGGEVSHSH
jgi:isocitrate dehydrogenase